MEDPALNSTLDKLSASIDQQAISSINNLIVPEFRGLPDEDVCEFLSRFKMATIALPENHRCLALNKALKGAAMTWAKSNIKSLMASANWKSIKRQLIERFDHPDRTMRYRERLSKLKYDPDSTTLTSYVEAFTTLYRKAHRSNNSEESLVDSDAIRALKLNLPDRVVRGLNYLDDKWMDYTNIADLIKSIRRYETKILPYEDKEESTSSPITKDELLSVFKELKSLKDQVKTDLEKHREHISTGAKALATITAQAIQSNSHGNQSVSKEQSQANQAHHNYRRYNNYSKSNNYQNNRRPNVPYRQNYHNNKRPRVEQTNNSKQVSDQTKSSEVALPAITQSESAVNKTSSTDNHDQNQLVSQYEAKYGKPPNPCHICQGNHFNRHCPLLLADLN